MLKCLIRINLCVLEILGVSLVKNKTAQKLVNLMEIGVITHLFGLKDLKIWLISRRLTMVFGGWK